jgi:hypothetical protein
MRLGTVMAVAAVALVMVTSETRAQPVPPPDFDFLERVWDVTETFKVPTPDGRESAAGRWTARKVADGRVLEDEFRLFDSDGSTRLLAMTCRAWDAAAGQWTFRLVDTGRGGWSEGTATRVGDEMHLEQRGPKQPDGSQRLLRIRYYGIRADRFSWVADLSPDGGATWIADAIRIEARRVSK